MAITRRVMTGTRPAMGIPDRTTIRAGGIPPATLARRIRAAVGTRVVEGTDSKDGNEDRRWTQMDADGRRCEDC